MSFRIVSLGGVAAVGGYVAYNQAATYSPKDRRDPKVGDKIISTDGKVQHVVGSFGFGEQKPLDTSTKEKPIDPERGLYYTPNGATADGYAKRRGDYPYVGTVVADRMPTPNDHTPGDL